MKNRTLISILAAMCLAVSACSGTEQPQTAESSASGTSGTIAQNNGSVNDTTSVAEGAAAAKTSVSLTSSGELSFDPSELFTARDFETGYSECTEISLSESGASVSGSGASASGNTVIITDEGSYRITGSISDGQIVVDAQDKKVQIVLDNASVTSAGSAALYVKEADKVFVTLAAGSTNTLASSGEFTQTDENKIDGAVFAESDITFNGSGTLNVNCESAHGVVCKDDLKFTGGTYTITAAKKGIDCNESVRAAEGNITINSGTDGIHAENSSEAAKGFVYIGGGNVSITSGSDAIDASGDIAAADGTVSINAGGGAANAPAHTENNFRYGNQTQTSGIESSGGKGIKSDSLILISGGTFVIDSCDDAIHSNGAVSITGGTMTVNTGDDGIHAETDLSVSGGNVMIANSYEGIEGEVITISGGSVYVKASDDGMNAAGSSTGSENTQGGKGMFDSDSSANIFISGGEITVNADGDGIDSNGFLTVSGGNVYVSGPTNSGNGALDYGISAVITGGTVIAAGADGMAENFGSDSTQGSILYSFGSTLSAGTEIVVKDSSGSTLAAYSPEKAFSCAVISTPEIAAGSTYTISAGGKDYTVEMTSNIYGTGSGMGRSGGMGGFGQNGDSGFGGRGGRRNDGQFAGGEFSDGTMPEFMQDGGMMPRQNGERMRFGQNGGELPADGTQT